MNEIFPFMFFDYKYEKYEITVAFLDCEMDPLDAGKIVDIGIVYTTAIILINGFGELK